MRSVTLYACEICGEEYRSQEEAQNCENSGTESQPVLYAVGDAVLVKTGYDGEFEKRTITSIHTKNRHVPGYTLDKSVITKHNTVLIEGPGMDAFEDTRFAENSDLIPVIEDVVKYILSELPDWIMYNGVVYNFRIMNDGCTELRLGYITDLTLDPLFEPPFGGPQSTIYWDEGIRDDNRLKVALWELKHFLTQKGLH